MYNRVVIDNNKKNTLNIGVIIFIFLISIFFIRVLKVLSDDNERGGLAYVQLLNFSLPVVETEAYNEEDFAENKLSIKRVCLDALGLSNLSPVDIIKSEVCFFNDGKITSDSYMVSNSYNPFVIDEGSINMETESAVTPAIDESLKKTLNPDVPEVLIYHTHTQEGYGISGEDTTDANSNVVGVGEELKNELEQNYGISVIHDTTNHSESYVGCYQRSNETVRNYLQQYGDFKMIIDLHRDSVSNKNAVTANINGENVAKIMFVNAKNSSRYAKNAQLAQALQDKANELYPGFARSIYTYNSGILAFNQDLSDNSVLIECGSNVNTMDEAKNSAKYIARIIAEYLNRPQ